MTSLPDIVAQARDLVEAYEEIITRAKILRIEVLNNPGKLDAFIPLLKDIVDKTNGFLKAYSSIEYDENDYYGKYLKTYYNYLIMISIPYLKDLLNEIRARVDDSRKHVLEESLLRLNYFLENYRSTFDKLDESTP